MAPANLVFMVLLLCVIGSIAARNRECLAASVACAAVAEIGGLQRLAGENAFGGAFHRDPSEFEHVGEVGEIERPVCGLLDQQAGQPRLLYRLAETSESIHQ